MIEADHRPQDDRSPLAKGLTWATRASTVSLSMVAPGLVGYWVDQRLGTRALFTILGFALGMSYGFWQLVRWTK